MSTALPLVDTATAGMSDDAFVVALESAARPHLTLALRMLGNEEDAREVLQEAHFRAWRHRGSVREGAALHGWLRQIVARECLRALRRRALRRWWPFGEALPDVASGEPGPEALVGDREAVARVRRAVEALPARQRLIWGLRFDEGWSVAEIATATGVSIDTVKTHLGRALGTVSGRLEAQHAV